MTTIEELFYLHNARSGSFGNYEPGEVAFVTNGSRNNGILGFVTPLDRDCIFNFVGLAVSTFCEATVQVPPFLLRGNGGSGLIALEPREEMSLDKLVVIAAYINIALSWRFHWSRQATIDRIRRHEIPSNITSDMTFNIQELLPPKKPRGMLINEIRFERFTLGSLYDLIPGQFHNVSNLAPGDIPVISCTEEDNGIIGFYDVPEESTYIGRLTVAFNGSPLTSKYHPYRFAAKDDLAVCLPKRELRLTTEVFIQYALNRERWRYSYYRKCFAEKLRRFEVPLPSHDGELDEDAMQHIIALAPYWTFVESVLGKTLNGTRCIP